VLCGTTWQEEEVGPGAARARARGGARRQQWPIPTEAGGGQGDKGGHAVVRVWCGARPWAGLGRKGSMLGRKKRSGPSPE
jgi:hypothetical protein